MAKNIKQIYDGNPSTTRGANDLSYVGKSPYGSSNDSAIKYSDELAQYQNDLNFTKTNGSVVDGDIVLYDTDAKHVKSSQINVDVNRNVTNVRSLDLTEYATTASRVPPLAQVQELYENVLHVTPGASDVNATGSALRPFGTVTAAYAAGVALAARFVVICAPGTHTFGSLELVPFGFIEGYGIGATRLNCTGGITIDETKWISTGSPDQSGFLNATLIFNTTSFTISPNFSANLYFINVDGISTTPLIQGFTSAVYISGSRFNYMNFIGSLIYLKDSHILGKILASTRNPDTEVDIADCYVQSIGCTHADDINVSSYGSFSTDATIISPYFENTGRLINLTGDNTTLNINSETINSQIVSGEPTINYLDTNIIINSSATIDLSIFKPNTFFRTYGSGSPYIEASVPSDFFYNFGIGTTFKFEQVSASLINFVPQDVAVTIDVFGGGDALSGGPGSVSYITKTDANRWVVYGGLSGAVMGSYYWTTDGDLSPNSNNIAGSASLVTLTLPDTSASTAPYNGEIKISWGNTGGWKIQCNLSDLIYVGDKVSALGGYIASTGVGDGLTLKLVAPSIWVAKGIQGTISIDGTATNNAINQDESTLIVTGNVNPMIPGITYIANSGSLITFTLPSTLNTSEDTFSVMGRGAGGWKIAQQSGQTINWTSSSSTTTGTGGYLQFTDQYDAVKLRPISSTNLGIESSKGNITVV